MLNRLEWSAGSKVPFFRRDHRGQNPAAGAHIEFTYEYLSHFDSLAKHFVYSGTAPTSDN
jgi:hypothetical protein